MQEDVQPAPPCTLIVFGAAGDLTRRLLVPALANLRRSRLLPDGFALLGVARADMNTESFRRQLGVGIGASATIAADDWQWLVQRTFYLRGDFGDAELYDDLAGRLAGAASFRSAEGRYLFYLATPPQAFADIVQHLARANLTRERDHAWRRVIVEKPFGSDLASALALNAALLGVLEEQQIYRIDHYLGKESVQNVMVLRFANGIFEPLWNRNHIDHVQITVAEALGVERRGRFYDATGALRDMVPNHLFQLLTLTAMEPPTCFGADAVRTETAKALQAIHPMSREDAQRDVVRGQYVAGTIAGRRVEAYRASANVAADSQTETYVAMRLMIDNWRWAGVPFYLRTGKALATRRTSLVIRFKQAPFALFRDTPVDALTANDLIIDIQPEEGVALRFDAKIPGPRLRMGGVQMTFRYADSFKNAPSTGYETLIYDCMIGDATLFRRADGIEAAWRVVQPVLDAWREGGTDAPADYAAGSMGPSQACALLGRDGRHWCPLGPADRA
jgi:glucose-6-phosphate 1-dehydrogenase